MMRQMICPKCGNDDPQRILIDVEPILHPAGKQIGYELKGYACAFCATRMRQRETMNGDEA